MKAPKKPKLTVENIIIKKPEPVEVAADCWLVEPAKPEPPVSELKDSGARRQFSTGSVRDIAEGKGRADLIPLAVAGMLLESPVLFHIEEYVWHGDVDALCAALRAHLGSNKNELAAGMLDVALQYEAGCKKYGNRNWQLGQNLHCYIDSGVRHYLKHLRGDTDEPHARAFVWNILGAIWTHINKPELIDLPFKEAKQG